MSDLPPGARAVVVTASNRASAGVYEDRSGQALAAGLRELGFTVDGPHVRPDDVDLLAEVLREAVASGADVVLTTGGTGLSPTDVTPEATRQIVEREAPGIAEAMRAESMRHTPMGMLARGMAGIAHRTLIVNFPGNPKAIAQLFPVIAPTLSHAAETLVRKGGRDGRAGGH
jgi:molybdenum cofactor synthesis domain-containing protein